MDTRIILIILVLGGTNFIIRFLPAVFLNKFTLPKVVEEWLSYVPVATMAAIVMPELLKGGGQTVYLSWSNLNLLSAVPTILVAAKTKSLGFSLATGMGTMALLRIFIQ
ncbi:MAG: AzlD domain-containing protein [Bacillota bacterium]|jgi:branched-subunit amino acid transport protein|nr:AzlD domain-containing protein [Clostridia bacterium]